MQIISLYRRRNLAKARIESTKLKAADSRDPARSRVRELLNKRMVDDGTFTPEFFPFSG
jgi:hypothetical protein